MTVPTLTSITPAVGPTAGGDLVRITGTGFADRLSVMFGDQAAAVLVIWPGGGGSVADVRIPAHAPALVDVTLQNLDLAGAPIPGEQAVLPDAYTFKRPRLAPQSDLTRLVRTLLQMLRLQVLGNVSFTAAVDYRDDETGDLELVTVAELPSLVLTGPRVTSNRFYSLNKGSETEAPGPTGPEIVQHGPTYTVDLRFTITASSRSAVELLNIMAAMGTFLSRNHWLSMPRDPDHAAVGSARWEMDPDGEFRTSLDGPDDLRAFTCGLVVRGFDLDEGQPLSRTKAVDTVGIGAEHLQGDSL